MKQSKTLTGLIVVLLLASCLTLFSSVNVVKAQGAGIQLVQKPNTPTQITSNLAGYPIEFNGTYQSYFKTDSMSTNAINFFNNGYNFTMNTATSQLNYYNSSISMLNVVGMQAPMNPQHTTANIVGNVINYVGAWTNTNLSYSCGINGLKETLAISAVSPPSSKADFLQYQEFCYYNSSLAVYHDGIRLLNPSGIQFNTTGEIDFNNAATNLTEFWLPSPSIYDTVGNQTTGNYGVLANNGVLTVYIRIPVSFLNSAVYPVYLDPPVKVQGYAQGTSVGASLPITLASTPTSGNVLILEIENHGWNEPYTTISSISQTGVTWSALGNPQVRQQNNIVSSHMFDLEVWFGVVGIGASKNLTVTLSQTPYYASSADICEFSGVATSSFLDKTATNYGATSANANTGTTATTTQAAELWIGAIMGGVSTSTPTNGFTLLDGIQSGSYQALSYLYKVVSATGAANASVTSADAYWVSCIATFKASASSTNYPVAASGSISTSWSLNDKWSSIIGLSQTIVTSWNQLPKWASIIQPTLAFGTALNVINQWGSNVGLSENIGSSWNALAGWSITLSSSLSTSWNVMMHWGSSVGASFSSSLSFNGNSITTAITNLGASLSLSWNVLVVHFGFIDDSLTGGGDFGLFLALGLLGLVTACACTWIFLRRKTSLQEKKDVK